MDQKYFVALLSILYQGLNLMAKGIKGIIDEVKQQS